MGESGFLPLEELHRGEQLIAEAVAVKGPVGVTENTRPLERLLEQMAESERVWGGALCSVKHVRLSVSRAAPCRLAGSGRPGAARTPEGRGTTDLPGVTPRPDAGGASCRHPRRGAPGQVAVESSGPGGDGSRSQLRSDLSPRHRRFRSDQEAVCTPTGPAFSPCCADQRASPPRVDVEFRAK